MKRLNTRFISLVLHLAATLHATAAEQESSPIPVAKPESEKGANSPGQPAPFTPAADLKGDWTFTADPKLPTVLIIGDSISIGYTRAVRTKLAGKANVWRPMRGKRAVPSSSGQTPPSCRKARPGDSSAMTKNTTPPRG